MKRLEMIDTVPVFLEEYNFCERPCYYLQLWGGCDKITFSEDMEEEELLKLLDIVTEFVNKSLELKKGEAQ